MASHTILVCVLVCVVSVASGPVKQGHPHEHKHAEHAPGEHESFNITVSISSGKEDPTWVIDNDSRDPDVKTIIKILRKLAIEMDHQQKKYLLPDVGGYRGFEIVHEMAQGSHSIVIPRCKFLKLEYLLVDLTAKNSMSPGQKSAVINVLKVCFAKEKAKKAAAAAKAKESATQAP